MVGTLARLGLVGLGAAAAMVASARDAHACSPDPCAHSNRFLQFELHSEALASNGVLVFRSARGDASLELADVLPYITVSVTSGGTELTGTLEAPPSPWRGFAWRPAEAFAGGESLDVAVSIDNDALALVHDDDWGAEPGACAPNIDAQFSAQVSTQALDAFGLQQPEAEAFAEIVDDLSLTSIVCCDGAMPFDSFGDCSGDTVAWSEGHCEALAGVGHLEADLTLPAPEDIEASDIVLSLIVDGEARSFGAPGQLSMHWSASAPFCAQLQARSLSRGDTWQSEEVCLGDDIRAVGPIVFDPAPELARQCTGEPYVCEVADGRWDEDACSAWIPPDDDDGGEDGLDDGGSDDGDGDVGDGGEGSDGDGGGETGDGGDAGQDGGDGDGMDGGVAGRGCSCRADERGGAPVWGILALGVGLFGLRRRRR